MQNLYHKMTEGEFGMLRQDQRACIVIACIYQRMHCECVERPVGIQMDYRMINTRRVSKGGAPSDCMNSHSLDGLPIYEASTWLTR